MFSFPRSKKCTYLYPADTHESEHCAVAATIKEMQCYHILVGKENKEFSVQGLSYADLSVTAHKAKSESIKIYILIFPYSKAVQPKPQHVLKICRMNYILKSTLKV